MYYKLLNVVDFPIQHGGGFYYSFYPLCYWNAMLQGQPLGFDTKYLALGDRNMQVKFSLKVVWGS